MTQWCEYYPQTVNVRHQTNIIVIKAHEDHLWQDEVCHPLWQEAAWSENDLYKDCFWCQATDQFKISTHTLSTKLTAFIQCCLTHEMKCVKKLDLKNCSLKIISICCWPHCEFNVSPLLWTINWLTNALFLCIDATEVFVIQALVVGSVACLTHIKLYFDNCTKAYLSICLLLLTKQGTGWIHIPDMFSPPTYWVLNVWKTRCSLTEWLLIIARS